ncbi:peptide ABC transporter substrate-binding protein [Salimicrobium jeotgali]|uniref:Peptide ABC transporter substrate-binding protein n=1 Tax=Salimicrobium jeotgali TaxID=1230341 RepID=K2GBL3_9BACI|nr:peptide ABC transporter substrate-binding protein [Salimicrobium jeotgali]AKG04967.1 peptide ABC transporter substrate-binding protein [Salimicrobium jeotgali]EKE31647.1 peptide/nickel ABC transporter extracellular binding protein [Salimicrobium jeotgali]MBM7696469.1 oligopeptide transport system substrate-binding protein [Salimicrobium jeotgali]
MKKSNWLLLVLTLALSMFLAACSGGGDSSSEGGESSGSDNEGSGGDGEQVLNLSESADIPTMDSSMATDTVAFQWLGSTKDGLYRLDEDAQAEPGIAKDHEMSEDGTTYTFNLREDAKWSNGDPVTAEDFVYAWQRAVNPDTGSEYGPYMMNGVIKNAEAIASGEMEVSELGVTAKDEHTLEVQLEQATPYFESLTAFGTFLPLNQDFVEEQGDNYAQEADALLSNGPFKFEEWNHGEGWTVVKNEDYWDAENVKLDKIDVNVVKDTATGVNLFNSGEIDRTGLSSEFVDEYRSSEEFQIKDEPTLFYIKMNQEGEVLSNVNARKAIQYAIDRQGMVDVILNNGSKPSTGQVPENFVSHPESGKDFRELSGDLVTSDLEKAKEHWTKAKEELGKDSVELEYLGGDTEVAKNLDAYIKDQLEQLEGLSVKVNSVPFEVRLERDTSMNYQLQNAGWGPDYIDPNTFLNLWLTDGGNNHTGYASEEYDKLINEANTDLAQDPEARWENFLKAEELLMKEDAVLAPLYQRSVAQLQKPYVKGVYVNPMGADYTYKYAYIEGK